MRDVKIPYSDFLMILDAFDYLDMEMYAEDFRQQLECVLEGLRAKKTSIQRRDVYAEMIKANKIGDEDIQHVARIDYLRAKRE